MQIQRYNLTTLFSLHIQMLCFESAYFVPVSFSRLKLVWQLTGWYKSLIKPSYAHHMYLKFVSKPAFYTGWNETILQRFEAQLIFCYIIFLLNFFIFYNVTLGIKMKQAVSMLRRTLKSETWIVGKIDTLKFESWSPRKELFKQLFYETFDIKL